MECPPCGLLNPPGSSKCDCGYDFKTSQPSETPGWPINAAWTQKLAASWSILWPAFFAVITMAYLVPNRTAISLGGAVAFLIIQALVIPRLVRKKYRSFRIYVVRNDGQKGRKLSMREAGLVSLWVLSPQLAIILLVSMLGWVLSSKLPPETIRSIGSLSLWLRVLWAGPYGIDLALRAKYPGFRLQAYGQRY